MISFLDGFFEDLRELTKESPIVIVTGSTIITESILKKIKKEKDKGFFLDLILPQSPYKREEQEEHVSRHEKGAYAIYFIEKEEDWELLQKEDTLKEVSLIELDPSKRDGGHKEYLDRREEKRILLGPKSAKRINVMAAFYADENEVALSDKEKNGKVIEKALEYYYKNVFLPEVNKE